MKIATLTFQNAVNYGAAYQAYALQAYLAGMGHDVHVLNYSCDYLDNRRYQKANIMGKAKQAFMRLTLASKRHGFESFRSSYLPLTEACDRSTIGKVASRYDAIVVGSDQVWNPRLTGGDETYFLDFANDDSKRVAYAASAGVSHFDGDELTRIKAFVERFDAVGVRERSLLNDLKPYVNCCLVLDPVLLVERTLWLDLAAACEVPGLPKGERYLLVYSLGEMESLQAAAQRIARDRGLRVVCVSTGLKTMHGAINLRNLSPLEFLHCLANASFVLSSSYHGICLSLTFGLPFRYATSKKNDTNSRIETLKETFGLSGLDIDRGLLGESSDPDYSAIDNSLMDLRATSGAFLANALLQ